VPGNHDFNYGIDYLKDFSDRLHATTICANITDTSGDLVFGRGYKTFMFEGMLKVGVIGLTTQYIPNWESPDNIKNLIFIDAFDACKEYVKVLKEKEKVDCVVVVYHGGFEKELHEDIMYVEDTGENLGSKILNEIEGIDVLITAHQHRLIADSIKNTIIIQSGAKGESVGFVDLEFEYNNSWEIRSKKSILIETKNFQPDLDLTMLVKPIEDACQTFLDEVIGYVEGDNLKVLDPFMARLDKHPIVGFINEVQLKASKAMISATSLPNTVTGFSQNITVRNVLSTYIFPNTLTVVEINGIALKKILEKNAEYFICEEGKIKANSKFSYPKMQHYNYDMFDGIEYTIDIDKPFGKRIVELKYQGKKVADDDIFSLALNSYRASGGGDFYEIKSLKKLREVPFDISELIFDYIIKRRNIRVSNHKNIKLISKNCK
jgi:2',3'-cyclic-nucleotide 2'-phosphodiesterase/3'-nucleotidase